MQFNFVGKLSMSNATEKFNPFTVKISDSGWEMTRLMFNAICGDNRHSLQVNGGHWADGHGEIYTYSKSYDKDDGTHVNGEAMRIPYKDRLNPDKVAQVADFRKFVIDLEEPNRRWKLKVLVDKLSNGESLTDDELSEVGLSSTDEVNKEYEKSLKKKHEYIHETDFANFIKKVIDSGKYKDRKFRVRGNSESRYSEQNETIYTNLIPSRIYLVSDDEEVTSEGTIKLYFNEDAIDDTSFEETGKFYINGFELAYDNNCKNNRLPVPTTVVIAGGDTEKENKKAEILKNKFVVEDSGWYEFGCTVDMLNGSQRVEITPDMLTEEQRELIEFEIMTLDDIRAELGGEAYGDRVVENRLIKPYKGYSKGKQETSYEDEDFVIHLKSEDADDVTEGLFDDDDL